MPWDDYALQQEILEEFDFFVDEPHREQVRAAILRSKETILDVERQDKLDAARFAAEFRQLREVAYDRRKGRVKSPNRCSKTYCMELREGDNKLCARHGEIARKATQRQKVKAAMRERLKDTREGHTHHFVILTRDEQTDGVKEIDGYLQVGLYPDGRPGELFLRMGKSGGETAWVDQFAICFSVALQHGVPLEALCGKYIGARFEPSGRTRNKAIPACTSLLDYVARYLMLRFGPKDLIGRHEVEG